MNSGDYHTIGGADDVPVPSGVARPEPGVAEMLRQTPLDELSLNRTQAGGARRHRRSTHRHRHRLRRTRRSRGYRLRRLTQRQLKKR